MADALWLSGDTTNLILRKEETQYYLDSMYLLADTADTERRKSKNKTIKMSQSFALEAWRVITTATTGTTPERSVLYTLLWLYWHYPLPLLVSAFSVRQSALYLSRKEVRYVICPV
jgi:hypothetical protein